MTAPAPCSRCLTRDDCRERGCAFRETVAELDLFGLSVTRYKVVGKGAFPVDMLREGLAWPARPTDSKRIAEQGGEVERVVELQGVLAPNFRNWLASSWRIVEINGVFT